MAFKPKMWKNWVKFPYFDPPRTVMQSKKFSFSKFIKTYLVHCLVFTGITFEPLRVEQSMIAFQKAEKQGYNIFQNRGNLKKKWLDPP